MLTDKQPRRSRDTSLEHHENIFHADEKCCGISSYRLLRLFQRLFQGITSCLPSRQPYASFQPFKRMRCSILSLFNDNSYRCRCTIFTTFIRKHAFPNTIYLNYIWRLESRFHIYLLLKIHVIHAGCFNRHNSTWKTSSEYRIKYLHTSLHFRENRVWNKFLCLGLHL